MSEDSARLLGRLAEELAGAPGAQATAQAVTDRGVAFVGDADLASITLRARRGKYSTLAATDDLARRLDELQYAVGEGPCLGAADGHEWYRSGDVGADDRWPHWGPQAAALGARSLLSIRLLQRSTPIGALNFYARELGRFDSREAVDLAVLYATHAAIALGSSREVAGLETALSSRHMIGMAQGRLIERYGLDIDRSFALLQRYSSSSETKLADVAEHLVTTGHLPEPPRERTDHAGGRP